MRLHVLQHVPFEGLGIIEAWARWKGFYITTTRLWLNESLPDPSEFEWLVIMGGPMSVHDEKEYPWLVAEKVLIRESIRHDKTILGICLGGQLVAQALGATVRENPHKEIGWFPVTLTQSARDLPLFKNLPQWFAAFHWHGETFDIPPGAVHAATSQACPNQAFVYGEKIVGLQFHLECTQMAVEAMLASGGHDLDTAPFIQSTERIDMGCGAISEAARNLEILLNALERTLSTKNGTYEQ